MNYTVVAENEVVSLWHSSMSKKCLVGAFLTVGVCLHTHTKFAFSGHCRIWWRVIDCLILGHATLQNQAIGFDFSY